MSFLTVNGIAFPAANGSMKVTPMLVGEGFGRAQDGSARVSHRGDKQKVSAKSIPMSLAEAVAWQKVLTGFGDHWSFDSDFYSDKGQGPSANVGGPSIDTTLKKYGTGALTVIDSTCYLEFNGLTSSVGFTAMAWIAENGAAPFNHYICVYNAAGTFTSYYVNGVSAALPATNPLPWTYSTGTLHLGGTLFAGDQENFDDLVVYPFALPSSWVAGAYAYHAAQAWPGLGRFVLGGDFHPSTLTCAGKPGDAESIPSAIAGAGFQTSNRTVVFDVEEA